LNRRRIARDFSWSGSAWVLTNEVHYIYDGRLLIQERGTNNNSLVTYTRGLDLGGSLRRAGGIGGLLARTDTNGSTFYHADGVGNITALIDGQESIVARYLYNPFGKLTGQWGSLAQVNMIQFSSKPRYRGLDDFGLRWNDSDLDRFLNQDPIQETGGINLYRFVGNNPVNRVDPHGLVGEVVVDESLQWLWDEGEVLAPQVEADAEAAAQATEAEMSSLMQKISNFFKGSNPCPVSRWGRPGLQPGDWVMKGNANPMNYLLSGKYQPSWFPTFGQAPNIPAPYSSGVTFNVPPSSVSWPSGIDAWKGIIGQRIYKP
jgi:RHS repeat-associated protein